MLFATATPPVREKNPATYSALTLRNAGYLTGAEQEQVRRASLLVAGCGLGSVVAEVALRTGFEHLLLADGDTVSESNLNRQVYTRRDLGENKALAVRQRLAAIHPPARIHAIPEMLTADSIPAVVKAAEIVIDCIDFNDVAAILALHCEVRRQAKTVISCFPLGWGSAVIVFPPDGVRLEELVARDGQLPRTYQELVVGLVGRYANLVPAYVVEVLQQVMESVREGQPCPFPQLGVATYTTAALAVAAAVRVVLRQPVAVAPRPIFFDPVIDGLTPRRFEEE